MKHYSITLNHFTRTILSLVLPLAVVGCTKTEPMAPEVVGAAGIQLRTDTMLADPCALVQSAISNEEGAPPTTIDTAIQTNQRRLHKTPRSLPHLERLGWAYIGKARVSRDVGYYSLAQQTAECIQREAPESAAALSLLAQSFHHLHRFKEAEALAHQLVVKRGLWYDHALLGDVLLERGKLGGALNAYEEVMKQRPGPSAYARSALLRWHKGDLEGAIDMMGRAVRVSSPRASEPAAWAMVHLARFLNQRGDVSGAHLAINQALVTLADYPPALHLSGQLLLSQGDDARAITLLEQAVERDPLPEYRWTLIEALEAGGYDVKARTEQRLLLRTARHEDPRTLAMYLATRGVEVDHAVQLASQELDERQDVFTLDVLAWALANAGRSEEALTFSRRALAEGTQDARLFYHAAIIASHVGMTQRALELFHKAVAIKHTLLPSETKRLMKEFAAARRPQDTEVINLSSAYHNHPTLYQE